MKKIREAFLCLIVGTVSMLLVGVAAAVQLPGSSPISATTYVPVHLATGTVITLPNGDMWVVAPGTNELDVYAGNVQAILITQVSAGVYQLSDQSGVTVPVIPMPDPAPLSTTAYVPVHLGKGAVITLSNGDMWVVASGSEYDVYAGNVEAIVLYKDVAGTYQLAGPSGITVPVIPMPDPFPVVATTFVPTSLSSGAKIGLANGQEWTVSSGSAYDSFAGNVQPIVIYGDSTGAYYLSDRSGVTVPVTLTAGQLDAPVVSLNPHSLNFGLQDINTTSASQTITVANTGGRSLSISSIAGSGDFSFTTTCQSTLGAGANCSISVAFTPTAANPRTGAITITSIVAASPHRVSLSGTGVLLAQTIGTISFNPSSLVVGGTTTASATATSGLSVTFSSSATPTICSVSGSTVTGVAAGTCTVAANQAGNGTYSAATQVTQNITVSKTSQSIGAISFSPNTLTVGANTTASATATSGLGVTFTSTTTGVCTVSGSTVSGVSVGTCTIAANQAGNGTYSAAPQVTRSINVTPAIPVAVVSGGTWVLNQALSAGFIPTTGHPKSPPNLPPGFSFPYGLFDFTLDTGAEGSTAIVTITYPSALPAGTVYWKYGRTASNPTVHWYQFAGAVISGNTITLSITDNADGDDAYTTPGVITDPGGPGVTDGISTTSIPTLSEWGMIVLASLVAIFGIGHARRRKASSRV